MRRKYNSNQKNKNEEEREEDVEEEEGFNKYSIFMEFIRVQG